MTIHAWIAYALAAAFALGVGGYVSWLFAHNRAAIQAFDAQFVPVGLFSYAVEDGGSVNVSLLVKAFDAARAELIGLSQFANRESALIGLRVWIAKGPSWCDSIGRKVAGLTYADIRCVAVGSDLSALAHEMAHILELASTGATDEGHSTWATNGIGEAIARYQAALATMQFGV